MNAISVEQPSRRALRPRPIFQGLLGAIMVVAAFWVIQKCSRLSAADPAKPAQAPITLTRSAAESPEMLRQALTETDRLDPNWRLESLLAQREVIPESQNAALRILAIRKRWPVCDESPSKELNDLFVQAERSRLLPRAGVQLLRDEVQRVAAALTELRRLAQYTQGRYPLRPSLTYLDTLLPDVQHSRSVAGWLRADAFARAESGDVDGALDSARAMFGVSASFGDDPLFIPQLVRMAVQFQACWTIERVLAQGQVQAERLRRLQDFLEAQRRLPILTYGARGERAFLHDLMSNLETGRVDLRFGSSLAAEEAGLANEPGVAMFVLMLRNFQHSHAWTIQFNNRIVELTQLPAHQQEDAVRRLMATARDTSPFARVFGSIGMENLCRAYCGNQALLCGTVVALALERYRQANQRWPARLDELVPTYLAEVPLDSFDGAPLRYRPAPHGVVVYSVGADHQDNAGMTDERDLYRQGVDIGIRLWNPERRRQPAKPSITLAPLPTVLPDSGPTLCYLK